jgi:hypothetical protein
VDLGHERQERADRAEGHEEEGCREPETLGGTGDHDDDGGQGHESEGDMHALY